MLAFGNCASVVCDSTISANNDDLHLFQWKILLKDAFNNGLTVSSQVFAYSDSDFSHFLSSSLCLFCRGDGVILDLKVLTQITMRFEQFRD
jgi:hypothetical protein